MHVITPFKVGEVTAYPKRLKEIVGRKDITKDLQEYREFCESHPNYFGKWIPIIESDGTDRLYDVVCYLHWHYYKGMLKAGARSIKFKDDLPRIVEQLQVMAKVNE